MSSPCWSLPHLLTSSLPQHEAPPGQHDLPQDDTVHHAPLPELIQSTSSANEPLSFREWRKPAQHLSRRLWAQRACDNFWKFSGRHLSIIRCTERIWRKRSTSSNYWRSEGIWCVPICPDTQLSRSRDGRDVTCWEEVLPPVPDALRRVYGKHRGLWSRRWRVTKVADFTTVCPKSFWETRCKWSFRRERQVHKRLIHQKIRELPGNRLHCFHQNVINRETKCGVLCVRKRQSVEFEWTLLEGKRINCWIRQDQI